MGMLKLTWFKKTSYLCISIKTTATLMDYKNICQQVQKIAKKAGLFIQTERSKLSEHDVETKSKASFVTYVDKQAEKLIVEALRKIIPDSGFIAEEGTASHSKEHYKWVVDPLDGTTNYIHGTPPYSVSIALMEGEEIVVGVIYEIKGDEIFYAWKGSPVYVDGKEATVSAHSEHGQVLIATGFPYYDFEKIDQYLKVLRYLMLNTRGIRRLGSAAIDLAYVAAGRFDGFYEHALHPWDVAAGAFLVKQAGGIVTDFSGQQNWLFGRQIVASGKNYFPNFILEIKKHLGS